MNLEGYSKPAITSISSKVETTHPEVAAIEPLTTFTVATAGSTWLTAIGTWVSANETDNPGTSESLELLNMPVLKN